MLKEGILKECWGPNIGVNKIWMMALTDHKIKLDGSTTLLSSKSCLMALKIYFILFKYTCQRFFFFIKTQQIYLMLGDKKLINWEFDPIIQTICTIVPSSQWSSKCYLIAWLNKLNNDCTFLNASKVLCGLLRWVWNNPNLIIQLESRTQLLAMI